MSAEERFVEFRMRVNDLAREMKIEVEFTTKTRGVSYMQYESACVEVVTQDTHEYFSYPHGVTFGERKIDQPKEKEPCRK